MIKKGSKDTLAYAIEHGTNEIFKGFFWEITKTKLFSILMEMNMIQLNI